MIGEGRIVSGGQGIAIMSHTAFIIITLARGTCFPSTIKT